MTGLFSAINGTLNLLQSRFRAANLFKMERVEKVDRQQ